MEKTFTIRDVTFRLAERGKKRMCLSCWTKIIFFHQAVNATTTANDAQCCNICARVWVILMGLKCQALAVPVFEDESSYEIAQKQVAFTLYNFILALRNRVSYIVKMY